MKEKGLIGVLLVLTGNILVGAEKGREPIEARALFSAMRNDNIAFLEQNLERIPDLNVRDRNGNSLIHALIAPGRIMPPEPPPSPRPADRFIEVDGQRFPVHEVVLPPPPISSVRPVKFMQKYRAGGRPDDPLQRRMNLIRRLVARGVPVNGANAEGQTPLHLAVRYDTMIPATARIIDGWAEPYHDPGQHIRFVDFLIGLGADLRQADLKGRTPVFLAKSEVLPLLLRRGASLEDRNREGRTIFLEAAPADALYLLQQGANAHAVDNRGQNRWFFLRGMGWEQLAGELFARQVDIGRADANGNTALSVYCEKEDLLQAAYLVEHGADVARRDRNGRMALHWAAAKHNPELLALLLSKGTPVDARDRDGVTPLFLACRDRACVELLLRNGADAAVMNFRKRNVLHELADEKYRQAQEMLAFFVARKVPLNQQDMQGKTPLALAYESSNLQGMKLLLESGADPGPAGYGEWSLLDRAEIEKRAEVVAQLRAHGARHGRSWASRHRELIIHVILLMGFIPLAIFLFGLLKPPRTSMLRVMPGVGAALGLSFFAAVTIAAISNESDVMPLFLLLVLPLLAVLLVLFAAIRTLTERLSPGPGIILSLLAVAGSPGLLYGVLWPFSSGFKGEGGMALGYMFYFGSFTAVIATLVYALVVWIKKLTRKNS